MKTSSVDYGYILGRDPKPLPPLVKIPKELIDGMGGYGSDNYKQFHHLCYTAFLSLRKNANLILNLLALMVDATIPDLKAEQGQAVLKVCLWTMANSYNLKIFFTNPNAQVQERFRLDLNDEEAIRYFESVLNSVSYLHVAFDR